MVQQSVRMTADELLTLPDDGYRYELVRGELRRMPPASGGHGRDTMLLGARLFSYVEDRGLGYVFAAETGYYLGRDPDTIRAPDVSFVRRDRISEDMLAGGYLPVAPDLAVEVVSPSESADEVEEKVQEYLNAGTRVVWLVYSRIRTIVQRHADGTLATPHVGDVLDGGDVAPGFRLPLADLFGDAPSSSIRPPISRE